MATKKDFPSFPTEVHSSHLRKMATALAHLYGDDKLRGTVHDALNHSMSTNHKSYKSTIRRHEVAEAKLSIRSLMKDKSGETKQRLCSGRSIWGHLVHLGARHVFPLRVHDGEQGNVWQRAPGFCPTMYGRNITKPKLLHKQCGSTHSKRILAWKFLSC